MAYAPSAGGARRCRAAAQESHAHVRLDPLGHRRGRCGHGEPRRAGGDRGASTGASSAARRGRLPRALVRGAARIWQSSGSSGEPGMLVTDECALAVYDALESVRRTPLRPTTRLLDPLMATERIAFLGAIDGHFASRLGLSLREIWTGGEPLSTALRAFVSQAFDCPVSNEYGASRSAAAGAAPGLEQRRGGSHPARSRRSARLPGVAGRPRGRGGLRCRGAARAGRTGQLKRVLVLPSSSSRPPRRRRPPARAR